MITMRSRSVQQVIEILIDLEDRQVFLSPAEVVEEIVDLCCESGIRADAEDDIGTDIAVEIMRSCLAR